MLDQDNASGKHHGSYDSPSITNTFPLPISHVPAAQDNKPTWENNYEENGNYANVKQNHLRAETTTLPSQAAARQATRILQDDSGSRINGNSATQYRHGQCAVFRLPVSAVAARGLLWRWSAEY